MLTPSEVIEHVFCPRFTWFMNVQKISQHEDSRYKVLKGREVHARRETENKAYLRRKIGVAAKELSVYLASPSLRMRGVVDEVLTLSDSTMAPLDYKYTEHQGTAFKTHRIQVLMYAMLVRESYDAAVTRGYVAYIRGSHQVVEVPLSQGAEAEVLGIVDDIFEIIGTGRLPKRTAHTVRCRDCCYGNICV
ncbi:MAG: CRISPR-associated protein Cas4 [Deltaproteobacteria bacterium]|nr:CRISPR-associated protein Cas4 [Deltaproteobacteria bacterium]